MKHARAVLVALLPASMAVAGEPQRMEDVSRIPAAQFFWLEREAGKYRFGDGASIFANGGGTVVLPDQAPDPIASVICLETDAGVRKKMISRWNG